MSKQNNTTLLAERQERSNPLFDPKALTRFIAESDDLIFVKSSRQAIWLFPNGQLVQPNEKDDQERTVCHYAIKYYFRYIGIENGLKIEQENRHIFNNLVTKGVGVVNLVPETKAALKGNDQDLTEQQKEFLKINKYKLYSYVKNHPITANYLARAAKI
ncbi:MAG: hypothetical protein LKJ37_05045 [Ligilactobacillus acidipiscis]|jgi:hypothetical protein|nr:hypothetical protein [Ligilactobacillus acidipiscis]MCI1954330.1 hypothetical protein [Ligilactobacillus acidipiscis]